MPWGGRYEGAPMATRRALRSSKLLLGLCCLVLTACGGPAHEGTDSGASCESGGDLDYDSFGRDFMARYCVSCHSSELGADERNGAPSDHDFDTLEAIHETEPEHIDHVAAAGEHAENAQMPPAGSPQPTRKERQQLGQWLACGAP